MTKDIRIAFSFLNHRKRKRLEARLGIGATKYLIDLWLNTAMNHPKGKLNGMTASDIAVDAGYEGDPEEFVSILVKTKFLDKKGKCFEVHDWKEHQGFVFFTKERSQIAKNAALIKWENERKRRKKSMRGAMQDAEKIDATRNAPLPTPLHKEKAPSEPNIKNNKSIKKKDRKQTILYKLERIIEELNSLMGWRRKLTPGIEKKVENNLKLDPEWIDKAAKAISMVPKIDDRSWTSGKVRFEWFFQMYNPRREYDPVVDKILDGAYLIKPETRKSYAEKLKEEEKDHKPASKEVIEKSMNELKKICGNIGKIPEEKKLSKEQQIRGLQGA